MPANATNGDWRRVLQAARIAIGRGEYADAVATGRAALEAAEDAAGHDSLEVARCLATFGEALRLHGAYDNSRSACLRALEIHQRRGADHDDVAESLHGAEWPKARLA